MNGPKEVSELSSPIAKLAAGALGVAMIVAPASTQVSRYHGARPGMLVSTEWLQRHLGDANLVVLHVGREPHEYDEAHIPRARFLPLDELVEQHADSLNELPPVTALQEVFGSLGVGSATKVVLYDEGGGLLAARAYFTLDYLGYGDRVAILNGGFEKWTSENRMTSDEAAHPIAGEFTAHQRADVRITTPQMHALVKQRGLGNASDYVLLDARSAREYEGAVPSQGVSQTGHLPGAHSLYWKTLVQSGPVPVLRSTEELKRSFAEAGAGPDKLIVTYCRTGMQSSFTYFVAKYLGYRVTMYDGSVYEWVHRGGYELVVNEP